MTISNELNKTFRDILYSRSPELFYDWIMGCKRLSNSEKEELAICSRIARAKVESK